MWHWVKACKGAALIAFFLPWMTVSCSSTQLLHASGWDLAIGRPRLSPQLIQMAGDQAGRSGAHASIWLLLALAAIVIGLAFAFGRTRKAATAVVATSISAVILTVIGTFRLGREAFASAATHESSLDRAVAGQIHIDWQLGYWLCLAALLAAAALAGSSLRRRGGSLA